jgi:hypothetical protein
MALYAEEESINIKRNRLILAEGKDDCLFLKFLLKERDDIQIINFRGNNKLTATIEALKGIEGFDGVKSILVFRDSEDSSQSAIDSINYSLRETGLIKTNIEPFVMSNHDDRNIGFVLFPGKDKNGKLYDNGTLEQLCLRLFKEESVKSIIKNYIEEFQSKNKKFKKPHKNELHALFSFTDDYVGAKIGETAKFGGFNFNSTELIPFLEMIDKM